MTSNYITSRLHKFYALKGLKKLAGNKMLSLKVLIKMGCCLYMYILNIKIKIWPYQ